MSKVWDNCTSCGVDLPVSVKDQDWRQCKSCNYVQSVLKFILSGSIVGIWYPIFFMDKASSYRITTDIGLSLDIIGAWFLSNGYSDLFAMAAGGFGGGEETFRLLGPKHARQRNFGVFLLIVGFLVQSLANLISN